MATEEAIDLEGVSIDDLLARLGVIPAAQEALVDEYRTIVIELKNRSVGNGIIAKATGKSKGTIQQYVAGLKLKGAITE